MKMSYEQITDKCRMSRFFLYPAFSSFLTLVSTLEFSYFVIFLVGIPPLRCHKEAWLSECLCWQIVVMQGPRNACLWEINLECSHKLARGNQFHRMINPKCLVL